MTNSQILKQAVDLLLKTGAWKVTKYLSAKQTLKVTRRRYNRGPGSFAGGGDIELVVNIGRPNYDERQFIKDCQKAKEPFPVKKLQVKCLPKRRK